MDGERQQPQRHVSAKEKSSVYVPGKSSPRWLQVKLIHVYDFVVGGYTSSNRQQGQIVGLYDKEKQLVYVGPVGTGFSQAETP